MEISRGEFLRLGLAGGAMLALPFGAFRVLRLWRRLDGYAAHERRQAAGALRRASAGTSGAGTPRTDGTTDYYEIAQRAGSAEMLPGLTTALGV